MKNNNQKRGDLGQHWTPKGTVELMLSLVEDMPPGSRFLEPSVGCGNIYKELVKHQASKDIDAIEVDEEVVPAEYKDKFEIGNFFDLSVDRKYDCIIGNPPYVNGRLLDAVTKENIKRSNPLIPITSNLYLHFIEKCVRHHMTEGSQIIFIIPNTFLSKVSFGRNLREYLLENGNITHHIRHNAKWEKAAVETVIFRWVKGEKQKGYIINESSSRAKIFYKDGSIFFVDYESAGTLSDWFDISVGCVPKSINKRSSGIPLIKNNRIEFFVKESLWSREIYSKPRHKILFNAGPTRSREIFYNTLDHDIVQATRHIDFSMTFKKDISDIELGKITKAIKEFFDKKDKILGLRPDGRWSVGITEMKNIPISRSLSDLFNTIKERVI